jgi:hypothetical protein
MSRRSLCAIFLAAAPVTMAATPVLAWTAPATIDTSTADAPPTSMVISPSGKTYVAWEHTTSELFFSQKTASGWKKTPVAGQGSFTACYDTTTFNTIGPSAAFTSAGAPKIASACASVGGGAKVLYSQPVNGVWKTTTVGYGPTSSSDASATSLALALSATGKASIVMTDWATLDITAFRLVKGSWHRQQLAAGNTACCGNPRYNMVDASFDPVTGFLGVAWTLRLGTTTALYYGEYDKSGTIVGNVETVPSPGASVFGRPSLSYLSNGDAAIAVQEGVGGQLSLAIARRTSGVWSLATVDSSAANVGLNPSLDTTADVYHVAYPDDTNNDLRYASSPDGVVWTTGPVVTTGNVGDVPSLAVKPSGKATISCYDTGGTQLLSVSGP